MELMTSLWCNADHLCGVWVCVLLRLQYIEQEMSKRKGVEKDKDDISSWETLFTFSLPLSDFWSHLFSYEAKIKSLYKVPEKFQVQEQKKTEEMLSNQMLSGIPEVNLGLE